MASSIPPKPVDPLPRSIGPLPNPKKEGKALVQEDSGLLTNQVNEASPSPLDAPSPRTENTEATIKPDPLAEKVAEQEKRVKEHGRLTSLIGQLDAQISGTEKDLAQAQDVLKTAKAKVEDLEKTDQSLALKKGQLKEIEIQIAKTEGLQKQLQTYLDSFREKEAPLREEVQNLSAKIEEELLTAQTEFETAKQTVKSHQTTITSLTSQKKQLYTQLKELASETQSWTRSALKFASFGYLGNY